MKKYNKMFESQSKTKQQRKERQAINIFETDVLEIDGSCYSQSEANKSV